MREIKFRGWNRNKMVYGCVQWTPAQNNEWLLPLDEGNLVTKDVVVMQFTGFKDKNGKEIYEGDIVKHSCDGIEDYKDVDFIEPIQWEKGCFWHGEMTLSEILDDPIEVIGNIYESGQLLNQKRLVAE